MSTNILKSLRNKASSVGKNTKLYVAVLAAVLALSQQEAKAQVGINESNPQQVLDVNGAIRINDSSSIALAGSIRFNTGSAEFEVCKVNGVWTILSGTNGLDGKTVLNGTVAPAAGDGVDGDFWINTNTREIYGPKTSGAWGSATSMVGPAGADGTNGTNGTNGVSIEFLGTMTSAPVSPTLNQAYYNSTTNESYVRDGSARQVFARDGADGADGINGTNGTNGVDGETPYIGGNGNWFIGTTDLGVAAQGPAGADGTDGINGTNGVDGETPYIGGNGNWFIGTTDLGVAAQGPAGADGADGINGTNGVDGETPYIGGNGNWFIGTTDLGVAAQGPAGADGADGINGTNGVDGETPYIGGNGNWFIGTTDLGVAAQGPAGADGADGINGTNGVDGVDGLSAYEVAVNNGFVGSEAAWLLSLEGADGADGTNGTNGIDGVDGADGVSIEFLGTMTSAPVSPTLNQAYYNSTTNESYVRDGSARQVFAKDGTDGINGTNHWTLSGTKLSPDNITYNVNIGKTTPTDNNKLAVQGNVSIGSDLFTNVAASANGLNVQGNVGLGTVAPQYQLQIGHGNATPTTLINMQTNSTANNTGSYIRFTNTTTNPSNGTNSSYIGGIRTTFGTNSPQALVFGTTDDGTVAPVERMRIDPAGNIGIGVTNPQDKINLTGKIRFNDGDGYATINYNDATGTPTAGRISFGGSHDSDAGNYLETMNINIQNRNVNIGGNGVSKVYIENTNSTFATNGALRVYQSTNTGLVALFTTDSLDTNAKGLRIQSGNTGLEVLSSTGDAAVFEAITGTNAIRTNNGDVEVNNGDVHITCTSCRVYINGVAQPKFFGSLPSDPVSGMVVGDKYWNTSGIPSFRVYTGSARVVDN